MSNETGQNQGGIRTLGPNGELRVIQGANAEQEASPAKKVADALEVPYTDDENNGQLTATQAGKIGGHIGGPMVRKLVYLAREEMAKNHVDSLIERQKK